MNAGKWSLISEGSILLFTGSGPSSLVSGSWSDSSQNDTILFYFEL
jgi:hypothetical protein